MSKNQANTTKEKLKSKWVRFLLPGRLATGFLLGCAYMLWLAIERKPVFDNIVVFIIDFIQTFHW